MSRRLIGAVWLLPASLLIAGCERCNILSSSNSFGCEAALAGGMILTAPVMVPYVLIEEAVEDVRTPARAPSTPVSEAGAADPATPPVGPPSPVE